MVDIDEDVLEAIRERFDIFDRKGDKKIDSSQILDVLRSCGLNPLTDDVARVCITYFCALMLVECSIKTNIAMVECS